jgi:hypothetical protein
LATAAVKSPVQVRSLFSKYENVVETTISEYISSIPENLSEAVDDILNQKIEDASDFVLSNRYKLQVLV